MRPARKYVSAVRRSRVYQRAARIRDVHAAVLVVDGARARAAEVEYYILVGGNVGQSYRSVVICRAAVIGNISVTVPDVHFKAYVFSYRNSD